MNNELNKHKNSDKVKWWLTLIAFLLIGATLVGMLLGYLTPRTKEEKPIEQEQEQTVLDNGGGLQVNQGASNGMSLMSTKLMPSEYKTYGVKNSSESAFLLTATITPENAMNQGIVWDYFWLGANSDFSSDNYISNYINMTLQEDNKTMLIECLAPFADTIVLQVRSQDNPNVTAFCELDYSEKVTNVTVNIGDIPILLDGDTYVNYELCPFAVGKGGVISVDVETSNICTVWQEYEAKITFIQDDFIDNRLELNGGKVEGIRMFSDEITNWIGESYYFDYSTDISNWYISYENDGYPLAGMPTADLIPYFSNIEGRTIGIMVLTLEGEYDSYTYTSRIICSGYTNSTSVENIDFSHNRYVF